MRISIENKVAVKQPDVVSAEDPRTDVFALLDDDPPISQLNISFYDGSTRLASGDEPDPATMGGVVSGYVTSEPYRCSDISNRSVMQYLYDMSYWSWNNTGRVQWWRLYNNTGHVPADFVDSDWTQSEDQSVSDILARQPLQWLEDSDIRDNDNVPPVGTLQPNIKVSLLDQGGSVLLYFDRLGIFNGESQAIQYFNPESPGSLGYTVFSPPIAMHVKVEEKTSATSYILADCGPFRDNVISDVYGWLVYRYYSHGTTKQARYTKEGIFWNYFDTSDLENFKITRSPQYDAEEWTNPVLSWETHIKDLKIFLVPRQWWGYFRHGVPGCFSSVVYNPEYYGLFSCPPKDFLMPPVRRSGTWTVSHILQTEGDLVPVVDYSLGRVIYEDFDDSNRFVSINLSGDTDTLNSFVILHKNDNYQPYEKYRYQIVPSEEGPPMSPRSIG